MRAKANEQVSFTLDTKSTKQQPVLRPESPTVTFVAGDRDDVVVLDQRFDVERNPVVVPDTHLNAPPALS